MSISIFADRLGWRPTTIVVAPTSKNLFPIVLEPQISSSP